MVRHGSAGTSLGILPYFVAPFRLAVKSEASPPQLANCLISTEAGKPAHQDTLTGMWTSPLAGEAVRNAGGSSSPCS